MFQKVGSKKLTEQRYFWNVLYCVLVQVIELSMSKFTVIQIGSLFYKYTQKSTEGIPKEQRLYLHINKQKKLTTNSESVNYKGNIEPLPCLSCLNYILGSPNTKEALYFKKIPANNHRRNAKMRGESPTFIIPKEIMYSGNIY